MKNIILAFNIIYYLRKYFKIIKLWKSQTVWGTKNTFYFFGYDFIENNNISDEINTLYDRIKNNNDVIFTKFLGSQEDYNIINRLMQRIYQVRIDVYKKL